MTRKKKPVVIPCPYTGGAPANYVCGQCGAAGVKLWREYQTFLEHQSLTCAACGEVRYQKTHKPDEKSEWLTGDGDTIGWIVPAVPTEDGETFWGYSSVPSEGVAWWHRLPSVPGATNTHVGTVPWQYVELILRAATVALVPGQVRVRKGTMHVGYRRDLWAESSDPKALSEALRVLGSIMSEVAKTVLLPGTGQ